MLSSGHPSAENHSSGVVGWRSLSVGHWGADPGTDILRDVCPWSSSVPAQPGAVAVWVNPLVNGLGECAPSCWIHLTKASPSIPEVFPLGATVSWWPISRDIGPCGIPVVGGAGSGLCWAAVCPLRPLDGLFGDSLHHYPSQGMATTGPLSVPGKAFSGLAG